MSEEIYSQEDDDGRQELAVTYDGTEYSIINGLVEPTSMTTQQALAAAYAIITHHIGGPTVPIVWDAEPWPETVRSKIDARQTGYRVDINKPGTYFFTHHTKEEFMTEQSAGSPPATEDVRNHLADIAALFRIAATNEGERALADLFEHLRDAPAVVADRPALAAIITRLGAWAKE